MSLFRLVFSSRFSVVSSEGAPPDFEIKMSIHAAFLALYEQKQFVLARAWRFSVRFLSKSEVGGPKSDSGP